MRASGILLHISSLPSPYGIGTLGKAAYDFADFLRAAGQHYWQILPIGPTSYGDSPYQSPSTCAGNPYFIDLDLLVEDGLLEQEELEEISWPTNAERVDYGFQFGVRYELLYKAFLRGRDRYAEEILRFRDENPWLEDYALFMALKRSRNMECWAQWPQEIRQRHPGAIASYATTLAEDMNFFIFVQFLFYRQWNALRNYVHELGIEIIGDIPIYVPYDSCDVWANPKLFQLNDDGSPIGVAGCPPDSFCADGQLWGNPLYDWKKMKEDGYGWWRARICAASKLFDVIRIDHFRGLESYWFVPSTDDTARNGHWEQGPSYDFINTLKAAFPNLRLIAEDLGFLTPEVVRLQKDSGFPGMKILEFAFDPREPSDYLPHRFEHNCICYSGTHDNETLVQWLQGQSKETVDYIKKYVYEEADEKLPWAILRLGMASVADIFIAQIQDYLELDGSARMNEPGAVSTQNWTWRMREGMLTSDLAERIRALTVLYER
ncbi:MAG: 4-alpha-glucanotransferase [Ruminococcaceae bacterium]|nr:4-alpha-glucanotransferase [Oscillospiraceae bacterium]